LSDTGFRQQEFYQLLSSRQLSQHSLIREDFPNFLRSPSDNLMVTV